MSTRIYTFEPEGNIQAISPDGQKVAFGNTTLQVVHLPNPTHPIWPVGNGRNLRFLDNDTIVWTRDIDGMHQSLWTADLRAFDGGHDTGANTALVAGNSFASCFAGGDNRGHWASALIATKRLAYDNLWFADHIRDVRMNGDFMLAVHDDGHFLVYYLGTPRASYPLPGNANEFQISKQGWITYGYYGPAGLITPDGLVHDISIAPWGQEGVPRLDHMPDGSVWAWSSTVNRIGEAMVVGRPLRNDHGTWKSDPNAIVLTDFPAETISVERWTGMDAWTVAGSANLGHTTPAQIHQVPFAMARMVIPNPAPPVPPSDPPPSTLPDIPWKADPVGTPFDMTSVLYGSCTAVFKETDGSDILYFRKSDPVHGQPWGAWFRVQKDKNLVGLWCDSSTGVATKDGHINWMFFDGPCVWMPLHGKSGWTAEYVTLFRWADGHATRQTVRMKMETGYGRYNGVEVFFTHVYDDRDPDPKKPRFMGWIEFSRYTREKEIRWEGHKDDANGVPHLDPGWLTQPTPWTPKEAYSAPLRPRSLAPIDDGTVEYGGATPPSGGTMPAFPVARWAQFRALHDPTFLNEPAGDTKDEHAREYVAMFAAQCAFDMGMNWGAKNAGGGRPLSKDVIAYRDGDKLWGFDMFSGLGENVTTVNVNPTAIDITGQTFVPAGSDKVPPPQDYIGADGGTPGPDTPGPGPSTGTIIFTQTGKNGMRYLTNEDGGGDEGDGHGIANMSRGQTEIDKFGTGWQELQVEPFDDGVSIKNSDRYGSTWATGDKLVFNRVKRDAGEKFHLIQGDGGVGFRDYRGKFICAERDAQGNITGVINVNRDAMGEWETFHTKGALSGMGGGTPDVGGPANTPVLTEVRVVNGRWVQQIVGASMLYALGPSIDPRAALDESRALGFQIERTFVGDLPQIGLTQAMALQRLPQYLGWCRERGLKVYASCGTNSDPGASWYRDCGDILRGFPDVVLMTEGSNEALQRGGWATPDKLREYVASLPGLRVLSAPDGDHDVSLDYVFNGVYAFHLRRDRLVGDLAQFDAVCRARGLAGCNQEPIGGNETNQPGRRSNDVNFFGQMGVANRTYGFAGFFHSEAGLNAQPFGPVQRQAAVNFIKGSFTGSF